MKPRDHILAPAIITCISWSQLVTRRHVCLDTNAAKKINGRACFQKMGLVAPGSSTSSNLDLSHGWTRDIVLWIDLWIMWDWSLEWSGWVWDAVTNNPTTPNMRNIHAKIITNVDHEWHPRTTLQKHYLAFGFGYSASTKWLDLSPFKRQDKAHLCGQTRFSAGRLWPQLFQNRRCSENTMDVPSYGLVRHPRSWHLLWPRTHPRIKWTKQMWMRMI